MAPHLLLAHTVSQHSRQCDGICMSVSRPWTLHFRIALHTNSVNVILLVFVGMVRKQKRLKNVVLGGREGRPWLKIKCWSKCPLTVVLAKLFGLHATDMCGSSHQNPRVWAKTLEDCRWQHDLEHDYFRPKPLHPCPAFFFFFFPSFSFFLVGKLLEPFKKWLFMVQTWKSNYACFSSALPWPVLQSANQQHPPWKASRHIHGYSATHLENPNVDLNVFWNSLQRCSQPSFKFLKISLPSVQVIMVLRTYSNRVIRLRAAFSTATHLLLCNGRRDRYHADFPHSFSE